MLFPAQLTFSTAAVSCLERLVSNNCQCDSLCTCQY